MYILYVIIIHSVRGFRCVWEPCSLTCLCAHLLISWDSFAVSARLQFLDVIFIFVDFVNRVDRLTLFLILGRTECHCSSMMYDTWHAHLCAGVVFGPETRGGSRGTY